MTFSSDIIIIGSGIGGATLASALAPTGAKVLVIERGPKLQPTPEARDDVSIFQQGFFQSDEEWLATDGERFLPGNYYYVGGNSKFYGAVMYRYRQEDFSPRPHPEGRSLGWPITYDDLEPWYDRAEKLFRVHGAANQDPSDPPRTADFPFPPVPDEPAMAIIRARLEKAGVNPASLPLAIDIETWLAEGKTGWDAFPNTGKGKIDAESGPLEQALQHPNVQLLTEARAISIEMDDTGKKAVAVVVERKGMQERYSADHIAVAAGAVQSSALLLRSANGQHPHGLANSSDQVGRNFMNHNTSAMITIDPFLKNDCIYQKTLCFNDFYNDGPDGAGPLGNVQCLGRITGNILKAQIPMLPGILAKHIAGRAFGWFLTSEDLPNPESRVMIRGDDILVDWQRSNMKAHQQLIHHTKKTMKRAGFPVVGVRTFGRKTTSHQCGTARMGQDPSSSVVDTNCQAHDISNLWVVDASVLPTSAAVNPALTIAALALKAGNEIFRRMK